jgi:hypothetical protein
MKASGIAKFPGVKNMNHYIQIRRTPTNLLFVLTLQFRVSGINCAYRVWLYWGPVTGNGCSTHVTDKINRFRARKYMKVWKQLIDYKGLYHQCSGISYLKCVRLVTIVQVNTWLITQCCSWINTRSHSPCCVNKSLSVISLVFFQRLCANYQTYITWNERITHFSCTVHNKSERGLFKGSLTISVWRYCGKSVHVSRIHERPRRKYVRMSNYTVFSCLTPCHITTFAVFLVQ